MSFQLLLCHSPRSDSRSLSPQRPSIGAGSEEALKEQAFRDSLETYVIEEAS